MRTLLLTTDTSHHRYFAGRVADIVPWAHIVVETASPPDPPYPVAHALDRLTVEYEEGIWPADLRPGFEALAPVGRRPAADCPQVARIVADVAPDLIVIFGTRIIRSSAILTGAPHVLNLHGGDPEHYRGLDTLLWAIWHRDFDRLCTTLHVAAPRVDTGAVVGSEPIALRPGMPLHALRAENTDCTIRLALAALRSFQRTGTVASRPLRQIGRFYSAMPAVLKQATIDRFEAHLRQRHPDG